MGGTSRKLTAYQRLPILSNAVLSVKNEWVAVFTPSVGKIPILIWFQVQNTELANAYFVVRSGNQIIFSILLGAYGTTGYDLTVYNDVIGVVNKSIEIFSTNNFVKFNFSAGEI